MTIVALVVDGTAVVSGSRREQETAQDGKECVKPTVICRVHLIISGAGGLLPRLIALLVSQRILLLIVLRGITPGIPHLSMYISPFPSTSYARTEKLA